MNHEIDLKNYSLRTDLTIDSIESSNSLKGVYQQINKVDNITITDVELFKNNALDKKEGYYITIEFDDVTDKDNYNKVNKVLTNEISKLLQKINIKEDDTCLIVGLGNEKSTPDALGPQVVNQSLVTNHIYEIGRLSSGFRRVCAISPGVKGQTGIETSIIIKSVVEKIKPDFVIVIDSLASQSIERVNKTIQITNTGIHPGSGIGNSRREISKEVLNIPVIAIGIPTVVDATVIVADTINYMYKHYAFMKEYQHKPSSKLTFNNVNYLNKNIKFNPTDKKQLLGLIGMLDEEEVKKLISEVLTPIGYNMMVTPKEVDFVIDKLSSLIALSLNQVLHKNFRQ